VEVFFLIALKDLLDCVSHKSVRLSGCSCAMSSSSCSNGYMFVINRRIESLGQCWDGNRNASVVSAVEQTWYVFFAVCVVSGRPFHRRSHTSLCPHCRLSVSEVLGLANTGSPMNGLGAMPNDIAGLTNLSKSSCALVSACASA
jgi:hypothetical protein